MEKNIYIRSLKLGFERNEGISFNEVIEILDIKINKDIAFKVNYTKWFFENFITESSENIPTYTIKRDNIDEKIRIIREQKAYLKGDALMKYIDYVELESTRIASNTATKFSYASLFIAILAVLIPILLSFCKNDIPKGPFDVNVINKPKLLPIQNSMKLEKKQSPDNIDILVRDTVRLTTKEEK